MSDSVLTPAAARGPSESRATKWIARSIAVLAVLARWLILRATHSTTEDFYITFRYAENIAGGHGFVYNAGERVLGTTTPLYTLLLSLAAKLHFDPTAAGKTLSIAAEGVTVWLICRLADRIGHRRAGWAAALLYATTSTPVSVSIGGMETALVTCAGMAVIVAFVERRPGPFALASAVLFLLRIDGIVLPIILSIACPLSRSRPVPEGESRRNWRALGIFALLALPWIVFATVYFGSPLPTSVVAKLAVYSRTRPGFLPNLGDFRTQFAGGSFQLALLVLFVIGAVTAVKRIPALRAPLLWMLIYHGAMLVTRVPAFGWYFLPPLPVYYLCAGMGLGALARGARVRPSERLAVAGLLALALPLLWHLRAVTRDISAAQRLEDEVRRPLGEWLAANARPTDTVMLEPIGYIGYYSRLRVLDQIGLVSPQVLPCYRADVPKPLVCIAERFHPDWLVLRPSESRQMGLTPGPSPASGRGEKEGLATLAGEYRWVRGFPENSPEPSFEIYRRAR